MDRVDLDLLGSPVREFQSLIEEGKKEFLNIERTDGDWMKVILVKRTEVIVRGSRR